MDDSLIISGGGSTAVATDELFADAARLGAAETTIADWRERARVIGLGLADLELDEPAAKWDLDIFTLPPTTRPESWVRRTSPLRSTV